MDEIYFGVLNSKSESLVEQVQGTSFLAIPLLNSIQFQNAYYLLTKDFLPIVFVYKYIKNLS